MDWSEILKAALSFFLVVTGVALAYLFVRMAGVFGRLSITMVRVTDEIVPILNKGQTTMDGVNREIDRVDEIMVSAVHGAKGAEKTMVTVSRAATAPVRAVAGFAAGLKEASRAFQARRAMDSMDRQGAPDPLGRTAPPASASGFPGAASAPHAAEPPVTQHDTPPRAQALKGEGI